MKGGEMLVWATCTSTKNLRLRFGEGLDFDPVMDGWLAGTIAELLETHDLGLVRIVEVSAPSARLRAHVRKPTRETLKLRASVVPVQNTPIPNTC